MDALKIEEVFSSERPWVMVALDILCMTTDFEFLCQ